MIGGAAPYETGAQRPVERRWAQDWTSASAGPDLDADGTTDGSDLGIRLGTWIG